MYYSIQACRAIAAILVVCHHLGDTFAKAKYFGAAATPFERAFAFAGSAGVAFFFVLSGFLISHIHFDDFSHPARLPGYLRKRMTRIYPSYLIVFVTVCVLAWLTPSLRETIPGDFETLLKSMLLVPQEGQIPGRLGAPVLVVAWSLQYELVFYLAIALAIVNRWFFAIAALLFVGNFIVFHDAAASTFPQSFYSSELIFLFGMGMVVSAALRSGFELSKPLVIAVAAALSFFAVGIAENFGGRADAYLQIDIAYGLLSAIVILALVRYEDRHKNVFKRPSVALLGDSSYALYLIHFPLISLLSKAAIAVGLRGTMGAGIAFLIGLIVCVTAGAAFCQYIERPLLRRLSRSSAPPRVAHAGR